MKQLLFLLTISGLFCHAQTVTDIDGNIYQAVTIGTQVWMAENLRVTRLNDGTDIPYISNSWDWEYMTSPAYCYYNNNQTFKETYGALYNWMCVNTGKLCPTGWHIPSEAEFEVMIQYLGGDSVAGGKLKETGTEHWYPPNNYATNESGFCARPGGLRGLEVDCYGKGLFGDFWTSSEVTITKARHYEVVSDTGVIYKLAIYHYVGFSVRCLKDNFNEINNYQSAYQVNIYPNPTTGIVRIEGEKVSSVEICDPFGRILLNGNKTTFDLGNYPDGLYFIKVITDKGHLTGKLLKKK